MIMFNDFKEFMINEMSDLEYDKVIDELLRLEQNHYLLSGQSEDDLAWSYMNGKGMSQEKFMATIKEMSVEKMLKLTRRAGNFSVILIFIPKRWFKQLPKNNILGLIKQMINNELPANYIWGIASKIDSDGNASKKMEFYRNHNYHANDEMFSIWSDKWLEKKPEEAIPLEKAPRLASVNFAR